MCKIAKRDSPFLDWDDYETLYEEAVLEVTGDALKREDQQQNGGDQSDNMNF